MKQFIIIISTLLITALSSMAAPADSLTKANNLYDQNEFAKAIELYESVLAEGYQSSNLYFNLGNACYKNGEITRAIINFERAKLLAPNDEDITYNLELANQYVIDEIEPLPQSLFSKWLKSIINLNNANGWAAISLICFVLTLIFALIYYLSRSLVLKKTAFIIAIILVLVSISTFTLGQRQKRDIEHRSYAIIISPTVTVKASPNAAGTDLFVIHEGLKVNIADQLNNWLEIRLEDGNSGWVQNDVLERI